MMKECVVLNGKVINIGPWDYQYQRMEVEPAQYDPETGELIKEAVYEDRPMNPLPEGAVIEEREVAQDADGGWYVVGDERPKSRIEQVEDENAFLALELATTQLRLDQTEQEQAQLLLTLVESGVI